MYTCNEILFSRPLFFIILFIFQFLLILAVLGFVVAQSLCQSWGLLSSCGAWASHCSASLAVEHGL